MQAAKRALLVYGACWLDPLVDDALPTRKRKAEQEVMGTVSNKDRKLGDPAPAEDNENGAAERLPRLLLSELLEDRLKTEWPAGGGAVRIVIDDDHKLAAIQRQYKAGVGLCARAKATAPAGFTLHGNSEKVWYDYNGLAKPADKKDKNKMADDDEGEQEDENEELVKNEDADECAGALQAIGKAALVAIGNRLTASVTKELHWPCMGPVEPQVLLTGDGATLDEMTVFDYHEPKSGKGKLEGSHVVHTDRGLLTLIYSPGQNDQFRVHEERVMTDEECTTTSWPVACAFSHAEDEILVFAGEALSKATAALICRERRAAFYRSIEKAEEFAALSEEQCLSVASTLAADEARLAEEMRALEQPTAQLVEALAREEEARAARPAGFVSDRYTMMQISLSQIQSDLKEAERVVDTLLLEAPLSSSSSSSATTKAATVRNARAAVEACKDLFFVATRLSEREQKNPSPILKDILAAAREAVGKQKRVIAKIQDEVDSKRHRIDLWKTDNLDEWWQGKFHSQDDDECESILLSAVAPVFHSVRPMLAGEGRCSLVYRIRGQGRHAVRVGSLFDQSTPLLENREKKSRGGGASLRDFYSAFKRRKMQSVNECECDRCQQASEDDSTDDGFEDEGDDFEDVGDDGFDCLNAGDFFKSSLSTREEADRPPRVAPTPFYPEPPCPYPQRKQLATKEARRAAPGSD